MNVESTHLGIACEHILKTGLFSDITLITGTDSTPAHRCILAALSPVFKAMFCAGFKEQESATVEINDIDTQALRAFLQFVYTGHLDEDKLAEHGVSVLASCHKYCLPLVLKDACSSALSRNITEQNCLGLLEHAQLYSEEVLASKCKSFISGNLSQIINSNGKELAHRNPELLLELVKDRLPPQGFREVKLWYRKHNTEKSSFHRIVLPLESTVAFIASEVNRQLDRPKRTPLRLLGTCCHRISRIYQKKDPVSLIIQEESEENLRVEDIAAEDIGNVPGRYLVNVHHFRTGKWSYEPFGEPFVISVHYQDSLRSVKQRIKAKLGVTNDMFESWKFARFQSIPGLNEYVPPTYLDDTMPMSVLLAPASSSKGGAMMPIGIHHTRAHYQDKSAASSSCQ